jgi:putative Mg2+ transporter-C (MgtC) family protein
MHALDAATLMALSGPVWAFLATPFARTVGVLALAFVLGTAIGFERQWRQRTAGMRTNVLVALGAAAFSDLGFRLLGADGATRIISYVVSGIGFLGAGVILKDGTNIRGLNTAATLWCSAAVGTFAGSALYGEAIALTLFVLAGNTVLRPMVNWIDRRPIVSDLTEASYRVHAICEPEAVSAVRDLIDAALEKVSYPVRDVETLSESDDLVELAATLLPTTAEAVSLDEVVASLEASPLVQSATWTVETAA